MEIDGNRWKDYIIMSHNFRKNEGNNFRRKEESSFEGNEENNRLVKH